MKVSQAIDFHLQRHRASSKKNTIKTCELVLHLFSAQFNNRDLASISKEEVLVFLLSLAKIYRQAPIGTGTRLCQDNFPSRIY